MMKMATGEGPPLRQGAGTGLDWFSVAIEDYGGGTPDLGFFLEVWVYIRGVGVRNKSGGPRGGHEVGGVPLMSTTQPSSCRRCWASKCRGL